MAGDFVKECFNTYGGSITKSKRTSGSYILDYRSFHFILTKDKLTSKGWLSVGADANSNHSGVFEPTAFPTLRDAKHVLITAVNSYFHEMENLPNLDKLVEGVSLTMELGFEDNLFDQQNHIYF